MPIKEGDVISERYRTQKFMKRGNASELWQAFDEVLRRQVAIKIIRDDYLDNSHYVASFSNEAQLMAQLEHPHIVPVYDYGIHDECPFQVQRYLGTPTYEDVLQEQLKPDDLKTTLLFAQRIGGAIDYIHQRGIVHRDIMPHNIIIDENNIPYLANFSLAQQLKTSDLPAATSTDPSNDMKSDLFNFGLLLYQALTAGDKPRFWYQRIHSNLAKKNPNAPLGIDLVLNRLTHPEKDKRYTSASEAIDDLYHAIYNRDRKIEGQIFVSYARKNSDYVYELVGELQQAGLSLWIDQEIKPSESWDTVIEEALHACDKLLLIVSPDAMKSENVADEWSYFLELGKPVYPFIHKESDMSFRLRRRQFTTSTGDLLADVARIVDVLSGGNPSKLESNIVT